MPESKRRAGVHRRSLLQDGVRGVFSTQLGSTLAGDGYAHGLGLMLGYARAFEKVVLAGHLLILPAVTVVLCPGGHFSARRELRLLSTLQSLQN